MKNLGARNGITVRSRSDNGITLELELGQHTISIALLVPHDGWKGTSLAVWETESRGKDVLPPNDDASAEDVAKLLSRILDEKI